MKKIFGKKKGRVNHDMLNESLLHEGGGLTMEALKELNNDNAINGSLITRSH